MGLIVQIGLLGLLLAVVLSAPLDSDSVPAKIDTDTKDIKKDQVSTTEKTEETRDKRDTNKKDQHSHDERHNPVRKTQPRPIPKAKDSRHRRDADDKVDSSSTPASLDHTDTVLTRKSVLIAILPKDGAVDSTKNESPAKVAETAGKDEATSQATTSPQA